ncbi:MAG: response regulator [Saprospiraceae bacterium]|nr:response regulator [Saprospiraceae bacterium]
MKKILVVEDNLEVRENLKDILELSDFEVVLAENGVTGVAKAKSQSPDLILCDVMMPELDGLGVLKILGQNASTASIPFIFLTAKTEKEDFRKGMELGADDYLTKPFKSADLLEAINRRLAKTEKIRQIFENTSGTPFKSFIDEARGIKALEDLSANQEVRAFPKKAMIFEEGGHPRHLYYVETGTVKTFRRNDLGKEYILDVHNPGSFIGHQALLSGEPYKHSARALEETGISVIPREDFLTLLYKDRDFSIHFIRLITRASYEHEDRLLSLAYNSIRKRVAESLLTFFDKTHTSQEQELVVLREDLAALVGTAKESVIRTLSDFKEEGLIRINKGRISIINRDKLESIPN